MMEELARNIEDYIVYWEAGARPLGGEWKGRTAVIRCFDNREAGLGPAEWGYEDVWRSWYEADERVIVEIREKSWLKSDPKDVMDQRTCTVIRFMGNKICEMREYTDSHLYLEFLTRNREDLPKFRGK